MRRSRLGWFAQWFVQWLCMGCDSKEELLEGVNV